MPDASVRRIREQALRTGVEVARAQWGALAAIAVPAGPRARAMVDAEALVLLSLAVRGREPRLDGLLLGWTRAASPLLSVQRIHTLAEAFPPAVREALAEFAREAADAGDRRWRSHAAEAAPAGQKGRRPPLVTPRLADAPSLQLRLRAAFGVGTRADLLAFLLALRGGEATVAAIAEATAYSTRALRTAAEELVLAGFAKRVDASPVAYCVDHRAWAGLLHLRNPMGVRGPEVPAWRYWALVFAFLADVLDWTAEAEAGEWSAYVASSRARDLVRDHAGPLRVVRMRLPDPREPGGAAFLEDVERGMQHVHAWCLEHL